MRTVDFRGCPLDLGPDVFITRNPAAEQLCRELDLGEELIAPSTSRAAIWARGRLRPFPSGLALGIPIDLVRLLRSGVVSPVAVVRAATDLVPRSGRAGRLRVRHGISGHRPLGRRGRRPSSRTRGGRDARRPAPRGHQRRRRAATFVYRHRAGARPAIAGRRSVLLALRAHLKAGTRPRTQKSPIFLGLPRRARDTGPRARAGLRRGVEIRTNAAVVELRRGERGHGWQAVVGADELACDGILLAVPSHVTAGMVAAPFPELASLLRAIPYSGVVTVAFAWPADVIAASSLALIGSGVLVPRRSGLLSTALSLTSSKWPRSARPDEIVVRASAGRHGDERALALDDGTLLADLRSRSRRSSASQPRPSTSSCGAGPASFPQYVVGHLARVARLETLAADLGPIALAGAWTHGIGIPACIAQAKRAASLLAGALR